MTPAPSWLRTPPGQRCSPGRSTRRRHRAGRRGRRGRRDHERSGCADGYTSVVKTGRFRRLCSVVCGVAGVAFALAVMHAPSAAAEEGTTARPRRRRPRRRHRRRPSRRLRRRRLQKVIAPGVTIGKLLVGGLTKEEATALVTQRFAKPLTLVVSPTTEDQARHRRTYVRGPRFVTRSRSPHGSGGRGTRCRSRSPWTQSKVVGLLRRLASKVDVEAVDASLRLTGKKPVAVQAKPGRRLKQLVASWRITSAFRSHDRAPLVAAVPASSGLPSPPRTSTR